MQICDKCGTAIPNIRTDYKAWQKAGSIEPKDSGARTYELCPTCFQRVLEFTESVWQ